MRIKIFKSSEYGQYGAMENDIDNFMETHDIMDMQSHYNTKGEICIVFTYGELGDYGLGVNSDN